MINMKKDNNQNSISIIKWCILCVSLGLISIFIHECGHGLANALSGIECSTGFNKVGDIYKYPKDINFRAVYSNNSDTLLDFGVPATLILSILGTFIYLKSKNRHIKLAFLSLALVNSLMRLIPSLFIIFVPLITGRIHIEDEYDTGIILFEMTGINFATYIPAFFSILVSIVCMVILFRNLKTKFTKALIIRYEGIVVLSFFITMIIANVLDNIIRINWVAIT